MVTHVKNNEFTYILPFVRFFGLGFNTNFSLTRCYSSTLAKHFGRAVFQGNRSGQTFRKNSYSFSKFLQLVCQICSRLISTTKKENQICSSLIHKSKYEFVKRLLCSNRTFVVFSLQLLRQNSQTFVGQGTF